MNSVSRPDCVRPWGQPGCRQSLPGWSAQNLAAGQPWVLPGSRSSSWSGALLSRKFIICFGPAFQAPGDSMLAPVPSQALEDMTVW